MEAVEGTRVFSNRYELTHLIARGGMAQVYRARDRLLDRPVALKVLFPELSVDRTFVERFRREAQAAANLSHPNIVPVFDWGEDDSTYFIVMEFVDGQPLSAVLRSGGPLPPRRVADIGANVASALGYAHRHGVVHRDVKPGNVLITADGLVKVTDFGIARALNTEESLTQTGAVMGTATYFSPEQAEGAGVDARSDIYSLGVVLFEMTTGRPPFLGESPVSVASKHVRDQPPLPRELAPSVPPALEAVIMTAMAKAPADRYPTADDLRADLLRFVEGLPVIAVDPGTTVMQNAVGTTAAVPASTRAVPVEPLPVVDPEEESRRRQTRRLLIALLALLVVLGVVAYFLWRAITMAGSFPLPNVIGEPVAQATTELQGKGLVVSSHTVRNNRPAGTVVNTDPAPNASVKKGNSVSLTVSGGPNQGFTTVPAVTNLALADAEGKLSTAGLKYKIVQTQNNAPNQTVIAANPPAGTRVKKGTVITLTVSTGPSTVAVPSVTGETATQAGQAIGAANLAVGQQSQSCSNQFPTAGQVSTQDPTAGTQVKPGSAVNLTISSGPCQATVPNVSNVGLSQGAATAAVNNAGFQNVAVNQTSACAPSADGTVVDQSPPAGTSLQTNQTVTIGVCNNAGTTTTTAPPTTTTTTTVPPSSTTTTTHGPAGAVVPPAGPGA